MKRASCLTNGSAPGLVSATISAITAHIRANDLVPGDKLPSEIQMSHDLNVSRTVVREAFRSLAAMRLIALSAGRRATVAELDYAALSPLIEHGVHTEQISIQQIYDVRRTIESRTATLAALRRTPAQAEEIASLAATMAASRDDLDRMMAHDIAFHLAIAKAACNPVFTLIVGAFEGVTRQTWPIGWRSRTDVTDQQVMLGLHIDLAAAIAGGDPQRASELMARHFDESVRALLRAGVA